MTSIAKPVAVDGLQACLLPSCAKSFKAKKSNQRFCSPEHKVEYWKLVYDRGLKEMERGTIHAGQVGTSERLQRVLKVLEDGRPHTTREIIQAADVCAVNAIISEIRANHITVDCVKVKGKRGVYQYTLKVRNIITNYGGRENERQFIPFEQ